MKYILDIDGTIIDGQNLNFGSKAFVSSLEKRHIDYDDLFQHLSGCSIY